MGTGNWRNLPKVDGRLLNGDQENWVAITRDWLADPRYLPWVMDFQGLGKTHAFIGGIEAKAHNAPTPTSFTTATHLWRFYFDHGSDANSIAKMFEDSLPDVGIVLATYWVRALWDFLVKATNRNLSRPASLVVAVPRLLDLKELVRLLRVPLAKGEIAQSSDEHTFVWPILFEGSGGFGWTVLDNKGESHHIDRIYVAEQLLRCFPHAERQP
jgi:hypothetical protein